MAATTTTANTNDTNDMKPNTPPSTAAADGNPAASESVPKPAGDAAQTASGLPPITKEPMPIAGAFLAPTNPLTQTKAPTPPPEPAADAADTEKAEVPENEAKDKLDTADNLAQQPPKPEESTAIAASSAQNEPGLGTANGASPDAPKPVSVQEVQDETMPAPATTKHTSEPVAEKFTVATTVDAAPAAAADPDSMDIDQPEPEIGDKRKVDESEVASGADGADKSQDDEDEPAEKKLKTDEEEPEVAPKKVGRPRKDKTAEKKAAPAPAPAGRTARRTRSQGLTTSESI